MALSNVSKLHSRIISKFPGKFAYCFAYGSGVKQQKGYGERTLQSTLIDLMFCVDDSQKWHTENLKTNPDHYSGLRVFGGPAQAYIQENYGAKVYCNTLIPLAKGCSIKYGVISTKDLIADLSEWTNLYVAGRLHKPVTTLVSPDDPVITAAIDQNLRHAIRTALLLLPPAFNSFNLFYAIANLSYAGDFRMIFGENKDKVRNIVLPQMDEFNELYALHLKQFFCDCVDVGDGQPGSIINQNKSPAMLRKHLHRLPENLIRQLVPDEFMVRREDSIARLAVDRQLPINVAKAVGNIVWTSSVTQSLKNIPTAGLAKAIRYSWKKALKTFSK